MVAPVHALAALDAYAASNLNALKREYLPRFGITARQFNAIRVGLEGKIDSIKARRLELIKELQSRIKRASRGETAGHQSCHASVQEDGSLRLQLRLPNSLMDDDGCKAITISSLHFAYGQQAILDVLASSQRIHTTTKGGKPTVKRTGSALSCCFVHDAKGWRVSVSCQAQSVQSVSNRALGAIGIDVNADHLAVSEVDRFDNWMDSQRIDLHAYGKSTAQAKALVGDAAVSLAAQAKPAGKPVVIETLDFSKKKAELESTEPKYARMLRDLLGCAMSE